VPAKNVALVLTRLRRRRFHAIATPTVGCDTLKRVNAAKKWKEGAFHFTMWYFALDTHYADAAPAMRAALPQSCSACSSSQLPIFVIDRVPERLYSVILAETAVTLSAEQRRKV
jgi:hypothetical protein